MQHFWIKILEIKYKIKSDTTFLEKNSRNLFYNKNSKYYQIANIEMRSNPKLYFFVLKDLFHQNCKEYPKLYLFIKQEF